MEKITINVPKGIRYISEWKDFKLPEIPTIINKRLTGCGFTEWCLTNSDNVILVSPRRILLENKAEQHKDDSRVLYVRNDGEKIVMFDKDLNSANNKNSEEIRTQTIEHTLEIHRAVQNHYSEVPPIYGCKFLVTYDSFRYIKDALGERIGNFYIVIDEFQSVMTDSRFKLTTGIDLLEYLSGLSKVCYVSATPMLDEYIEVLDEFKDLPYVDLNWENEDPLRVIKPQIETRFCKSITAEVKKIVDQYRLGQFERYTNRDEGGRIQEVISNEAVFYVNSVKNICDIIRKCGLTLENTNVLCARSEENRKNLRKAFGIHSTKEEVIGSVPLKGSIHKMFTLCTRTVYLGADFYSTCARTFIFSDANIDSLAVDISMDIPQILGRQRLAENPWKNRVNFYYKTSMSSEEELEVFKRMIEEKEKSTNAYIRAFNSAPDQDSKEAMVKMVENAQNYKSNYVAIKKHSGSSPVLELNRLVMLDEIRSYKISKMDYKDRFTVFNTIAEMITSEISVDSVERSLELFYRYTQFPDRMKLVCEVDLTPDERRVFFERIPIQYKTYYETLGSDKCRALEYANFLLKRECDSRVIKQTDKLADELYKKFEVGKRYTFSEIKQLLKDVYDSASCKLVPKASDLEDWFDVKVCNINIEQDGVKKRDKGYEILKTKEK